MKNPIFLIRCAAAAALLLFSGCYHHGKGLSYVAMTCPVTPINASSSCDETGITHARGGVYFLNNGFRPAPDIGAFLEQAHQQVNSPVLRNADVRLYAPMIIGIFPFGFQFQPFDGRDLISVNAK